MFPLIALDMCVACRAATMAIVLGAAPPRRPKRSCAGIQRRRPPTAPSAYVDTARAGSEPPDATAWNSSNR